MEPAVEEQEEQEEQGHELWMFVHDRCYHSVFIKQHMKLVATVADEEQSDIMMYWLLPHGGLCSHVLVLGPEMHATQ